ncbi:transcriptional regulator, partial [Cellulomonas fimi]|nr:transcriptional regulator [Cellulomonas fimi]
MSRGRDAVAVPAVDACVPAAGRGVLRRALLHRLDDVLTSRCGLVVGPRGSGKTTLMRQWARTCRLPVVWGRCTPGGIVVPSGGRPTLLPPDVLGRAVLERREPTLLVLDDAHELLVRRVEDELVHVLAASTPDVHVLLGTVRRPVFSLARSEFPPPTVVTGSDLRLRVWEVDRLFRDVYGHPLSLDDVEALTARTEGWAAAVHLFHRSTADLLPADRRRAVRDLDTSTGYVRDYLVDEVLAPLDRPLLDLLHRGAALDELTARRWEALVEDRSAAGRDDHDRDAATLLRTLDREWSLATTDDGVRYRLPQVLRRHLLAAHEERLGPAAAQSWRARAAEVARLDAPVAPAPADGTSDWTGRPGSWAVPVRAAV